LACGPGAPRLELLGMFAWSWLRALGVRFLPSRSLFLELGFGPSSWLVELEASSAHPSALDPWLQSLGRGLGLVILGSRSYLLGLDFPLSVAVLTSRSRLRPPGVGGLDNRLLACGRELLSSWRYSPGLGVAVFASRSSLRELGFGPSS
jgi:hypothetical protein